MYVIRSLEEAEAVANGDDKAVEKFLGKHPVDEEFYRNNRNTGGCSRNYSLRSNIFYKPIFLLLLKALEFYVI